MESEAETRKRVVTVEKGVDAAFKAAIEHLGEEEARRLFARVLRRPKRGQGKMLAPDRDARLLKEYELGRCRFARVRAWIDCHQSQQPHQASDPFAIDDMALRRQPSWISALRRPPKVRFASDSLLEGDGFEPPVPRQIFSAARRFPRKLKNGASQAITFSSMCRATGAVAG